MIQPWKRCPFKTTTLLGAALALAMAASPAQAQVADEPTLLSRIEQMERELAALKAQAGKGVDQAQSVPAAVEPVESTPGAARPAAVSRRLSGGDAPLSGSQLLIAGYAHVGMAVSDKESVGGTTFVAGTFNPALYFQYGNLFLLETVPGTKMTYVGQKDAKRSALVAYLLTLK